MLRYGIENRFYCRYKLHIPDLVYLLTKAGKMKLTGKDMHMTNLDIDKGVLDMNGKVDCICYMTDKEDRTFSLKRLFK